METPSVVIENVRVFDGKGLTGVRTVAILNGRVAESEDAETVFDGQGGTLLPGLIDSHVHLHGVENLKQAAEWGVTTMLDMGTSSPQLVESLRNLAGLTDIRSSASPASAPGGMQTTRMGFPASTAVAGPDDAERFVAERAGEGADYIKIIVENPAVMGAAALNGQTIAAIVQAAHKRGLRVIAHVTTIAAFELAVGGRVDVLTHAPLDAPLDEALVEKITTSGMLSVPTLVMMQGVAAGLNIPTHAGRVDYRNAERSVTEMHRAGIPILAGTDANSAPMSPFQVRHGEALHEELKLLVAAGLTPIEALRSATVIPAQWFELEDRGAVQAGQRADLLLVDGDPTDDIAKTRAIRAVWIGGERVR